VLAEVRPGVTLAWWEAASREQRDAAWAAAELLADQAAARRKGLGR
jgi:hypothetical protein